MHPTPPHHNWAKHYPSATQAADNHANDLYLQLEGMAFLPSPSFLGDFGYRSFGVINGANRGKTTGAIRQEAIRLARFVPNQKFTTVFVQKYEAGQHVRPHRDPRNNTGSTVIGVYGNFDYAPVTKVWMPREGIDTLAAEAGDVVVLPCTLNGVQGPWHSVTWDPWATGIRYCIILNTMA